MQKAAVADRPSSHDNLLPRCPKPWFSGWGLRCRIFRSEAWEVLLHDHFGQPGPSLVKQHAQLDLALDYPPVLKPNVQVRRRKQVPFEPIPPLLRIRTRTCAHAYAHVHTYAHVHLYICLFIDTVHRPDTVYSVFIQTTPLTHSLTHSLTLPQSPPLSLSLSPSLSLSRSVSLSLSHSLTHSLT